MTDMGFGMKKTVVCLLGILLFCRVELSAQGYFLEKQDMKLEYVRTYVADGRFRWRHVMNVKSRTDNGSYIRYVTESLFTGKNGKPLYRSTVNETTLMDKASGDISLDVADAMVSYIKARTGLNATSSGVLSSLPSGIQPGDTLPPVSAQAKVGPFTYSLLISERKVLRKETIEVPAGKFECIVVSERKVESGPGHNRSVTNYTWYSKGVGYVRHDTYVKGKPETTEILQSIH